MGGEGTPATGVCTGFVFLYQGITRLMSMGSWLQVTLTTADRADTADKPSVASHAHFKLPSPGASEFLCLPGW